MVISQNTPKLPIKRPQHHLPKPSKHHLNFIQLTQDTPNEGAMKALVPRNDPFQEYTPIPPHLFTHIHTPCNDYLTIRFQRHVLNASNTT